MPPEIARTYKQADAPRGKGEVEAAAAKKQKRRTLRMRLEERNTQVSTVVVGIIVNVLLIGIGVTMFILAGIFSNTDLYIVGGIFVFGAVVFAVLFIVTNCRPWLKDRRIHAQMDKEIEELEKTEAPTVLAPGQYNRQGTIILE